MEHIKELAQDILCNLEHGECFYDEDMKQELLIDVKRLADAIEYFKIGVDE